MKSSTFELGLSLLRYLSFRLLIGVVLGLPECGHANSNEHVEFVLHLGRGRGYRNIVHFRIKLRPLFQSESRCSSFHLKISFDLHINENLFL